MQRLLSKGGEPDQCSTCEAEHENEGVLLEDIGRLLGDVRASARFVPCPLRDAYSALAYHWS